MKKLDLKNSTTKKIDSPLAKYNSASQLFCVLCNSQVKSEIFWTGHVNGRSHQDALHSLKGKKRPQDSGNVESPSAKKKTLSNLTRPTSVKEVVKDNQHTFKVPLPVSPVPSPGAPSTSLRNATASRPTKPDTGATKMELADDEDAEEADEVETPTKNANGINLPEGFFDDPKEDARIRGKEWRDPEEVEWEKFTKEIANEELKSSSLRIQDEEDSTKTRELEEIEEQMAHWQKVIDLERKAEEAKKLNKLKETSAMAVDENEDVDEYDEQMDWRSKRH